MYFIKKVYVKFEEVKVFKIKEKCFLYFVDLEGQGPLPTYPL